MDDRSVSQKLADTKHSITLVLQDIDCHLANANQILSERVLPAVKRYGEETQRAATSTFFLDQLYKASESILETDTDTGMRRRTDGAGKKLIGGPHARAPAPSLDHALSPCPEDIELEDMEVDLPVPVDTPQPESREKLVEKQAGSVPSQVHALPNSHVFALELPKLKTQFESS